MNRKKMMELKDWAAQHDVQITACTGGWCASDALCRTKNAPGGFGRTVYDAIAGLCCTRKGAPWGQRKAQPK